MARNKLSLEDQLRGVRAALKSKENSTPIPGRIAETQSRASEANPGSALDLAISVRRKGGLTDERSRISKRPIT